jgi:DNA-binding GntR family transcriptional regulator
MNQMSKGSAYAFLSPVPREPRGRTTERVALALREAIVSLAFAPGEFIDKATVCTRLGVSRFPVSEALGRLADEGLVEILPQRGTRAARIRLPDVMEAMLIRRALEGMVTQNAAERLPEKSLRALTSNLVEQEAAVAKGDRRGFYALDLAFHEILVQGLGLARVADVIESSRANVDRVRRLLSSPRRHAVTLSEHRDILAAVASGDPVAARHAMEAHLDAVMAELEQFSAERPEIFLR